MAGASIQMGAAQVEGLSEPKTCLKKGPRSFDRGLSSFPTVLVDSYTYT